MPRSSIEGSRIFVLFVLAANKITSHPREKNYCIVAFLHQTLKAESVASSLVVLAAPTQMRHASLEFCFLS
jgi:hypothetical protein